MFIPNLISFIFYFSFVFCTFDVKCIDWGFSDAVQCSRCDKLAEFVDDLTLIDECNMCCTEDHSSKEGTLYDEAELRISRWSLQQFPEVQEFIHRYSKKYTNLDIIYIRNPYPKFVMLNHNEKEESISISGWSADQMKDFLDKKLRKA